MVTEQENSHGYQTKLIPLITLKRDSSMLANYLRCLLCISKFEGNSTLLSKLINQSSLLKAQRKSKAYCSNLWLTYEKHYYESHSKSLLMGKGNIMRTKCFHMFFLPLFFYSLIFHLFHGKIFLEATKLNSISFSSGPFGTALPLSTSFVPATVML